MGGVTPSVRQQGSQQGFSHAPERHHRTSDTTAAPARQNGIDAAVRCLIAVRQLECSMGTVCARLEGMTSRISHTTVDAHNAYEQSVWWCRVLGFGEDRQDPNRPGDEECMIFSPDGRSRVLFIEVPNDDKVVKNRIHFDLSPTDRTRDEEVERLLGLGGTEFADHRNADGSGWVTMADPEGNEFCVLRSDAERPDPYAHLVI
jgi:hypothetical protein